jgi:hypothetical protein
MKRIKTEAAKPSKGAKKAAPAKRPATAKKPQTSRAAKPASPAKKPEKPITPYRAVRLAIEAGGPDAGMKKGLALGLPPSQVKAYVKELIVLIERAKRKEAGLEPLVIPKEKSGVFEPHFNYPTREAAQKAALAKARHIGAQAACFHILAEGGKFAIAPVSYRNPAAPPEFKKGDTVMDTVIADSRGTIIEAGPQQSVVRYDNEKRSDQTISNYFLYKVAAKEAPTKKPAKKGKTK